MISLLDLRGRWLAYVGDHGSGMSPACDMTAAVEDIS